MAEAQGHIARFGVFEVDVAAGELRKRGQRIRLQEQPFQLLTFLLQQPSTVVGRDELRQKLWKQDTFVDFDHSLNTAINKIREALGDSAGSPRYIETIARKGYRFVAPVEWVSTGAIGSPSNFHSQMELDLPRRGVSRALFALIQLMYVIFYLEALFRLGAIDRISDPFLDGRGWIIVAAVIVTAGIGIPLRCYLMSAVAFNYRRLGEKFQRLFVAVLLLDQLWAMAPFLLIGRIGFGPAFAAVAALLYVPFSERTLLRMAYQECDT
jgi:cholera toxin transcriptional activator